MCADENRPADAPAEQPDQPAPAPAAVPADWTPVTPAPVNEAVQAGDQPSGADAQRLMDEAAVRDAADDAADDAEEEA